MALARVTVWNPGDILTAAALNGEFNNIINNPVSLISPLTANVSAGNNQITSLVLEKVAAGGTPATVGRIFYNTVTSAPIFDNGTQVRTLDSIRRITVLSSSQTWSRSTDVSKVWIQVLGGGGGGGASSTNPVGFGSAASGGGAGGLAIGFINLTSSMTGATITCATTAGAAGGAAPGGNGATGGTVSWADGTNTLTANGGSGGQGGASFNATQPTGIGGVGGSASGGSVNVSGAPGYWALAGPANSVSGAGASSPFGTGGNSIIGANSAGQNSAGFGAGGGGACSFSVGASTGGSGTPGVLVIYELG